MRINNNIMALNAHRQLGVNQSNASKSMERLSSGMRINRAGDDAAGLAISEKMRGQIRGLKQAARNAQDGISLIQTAEGALNETHSILQRMRELANQASTDTNTLTDRKEIQKEINQLLDEIDRIAEQTEFNTQKLLDGTYSSKVFHIGANADQKMDVTISDMGTSAIGTAGRTGGGGSATPGTPATGSVDAGGTTGTVTLTGPENDTYNGWTVKFEQSATASETLAAAVDTSTSTITVTWGSDHAPTDIGAINSAIKSATDAEGTLTGDITLSIEATATFAAGDLAGESISIGGGAAPAGGGSGTGENINSLLVDDANIDALAADWTDQQVADALQNAGSGVGVLTQAGANAAITNINDRY